MAQTGIPSVDLDIKVSVRTMDGEKVLRYALSSPSGAVHLNYEEAQTEPFTGSLNEFRDELIARIQTLNEHLHPHDSYLLSEDFEPELQKLGNELYRQLFPAQMKSMYRQWREKVRTIQISSAEWWIPWELIRPFDNDLEPVIDDDFLGARFQVTRWLIGRTVPAAAIRVRRMACVEAGESKRPWLPYALRERELLADLAKRQGIEDKSPSKATIHELMPLLMQGGLHLLHFIGHGEFSRDKPEDSRIVLVDGRSLAAGDLVGPLLVRIAKDRPLVYFNACSMAQQGAALTSLSGWPDAWAGRGKAGAFVAPQWEVSDSLAYEFTGIFYRALELGKTLGRAARLARRWVRRKNPQNATWLSFAVYGHPNARVSFGDNELDPWYRSRAHCPKCGSIFISGFRSCPACGSAPPPIPTEKYPILEEPPKMPRILDFFKKNPVAQPVQELQGRADASPEHGSAWIDLSSPVDFKEGDRLQLTLVGSAKKILIRFLPQGSNPDLPVGLASGGRPFEVPKSGIVTLTFEEDHTRTIHISVHGGPSPWGIPLGEGNGPVTHLKVERLADQRQGEGSV